MSKRFWTADIHFGHDNVIEYCHRPFRDREHMRQRITANCNQRVRPEDTVIHVGDFLNKGNIRGIPGDKLKYTDYLKDLVGNWILLEGNHDNNNKTKTIGRHLFTRIGPYNVFVSHYPVENTDIFPAKLLEYVYACMDFQICGHVHESWPSKLIEWRFKKLWAINVGVDQHRFMPIDDSEIVNIANRLLKSNLIEVF